jgi:5'-nucleotidase
MLDPLPDIVVSGINLGANMGDDTIYSGTVAAATEGYLFGIPSIAVSLVGKLGGNFETAAQVAVDLVKRATRVPFDVPVLLNVNVPDIALSELGGFEATRLGRRHKAEPVVQMRTPRGETAYWIGAAGDAQDAGPGTDFHAVAAGRVSITPLQVDLSQHQQLPRVVDWLKR